jgi:hypothetical protein
VQIHAREVDGLHVVREELVWALGEGLDDAT